MRNVLAVLALLCSPAVCLRAGEIRFNPSKAAPSKCYAGSLGGVLEKSVGPEFEKSSGFTYQGEGQGSLGAAKMISDRLCSPDVFISADAAVNDKVLMTPDKEADRLVRDLRIQRHGPRLQPEQQVQIAI